MNSNTKKIIFFLSVIGILIFLVRCDKPEKISSSPVISTNITQIVVTNTPVREKIFEEKPETNWFAAIDGTHGRLAGIFRDANGNPITNVTASYQKRDRSRYTNTAPQKRKLGFTIEPDGSYLSEPILPGMYSGTFSTPEHSISTADFIIRPEDTTLLEVCFGSCSVITCTVVDAETDLPVPDAVVTCSARFPKSKGSCCSSPTTPTGTFTVNSRGDSIYLSISHPDYMTEKVGIINDPKTICLFRGGDIHLKLLDTQGLLSTNTHTVVLYDSRKPYGRYGHDVARVVCTNGRCMFSNVSSGETPMKVLVDKGIGEAFLEKIVPGEVTEITVGLRPKGSLSVDIDLPFSNTLCRVSVASQKKNLTGRLRYNLSHFGRINYQTTVFFQSVLTGSYSVIVNIAKEYRLATNIVINSGKNT